MPNSLVPSLAIASLLAILLPSAGTAAEAKKTAVLIELFTSEGCSSCPPADRLLERIEAQQPVAGAQVIVLSEHVDYWDHLGWRDPFSNVQFSRRQQSYRHNFGRDDVYTPQMIVDGRAEFVGNDAHRALREIEKAAAHPAADIHISVIQFDGPVATVQLSVANVPQTSRKDELEWMLAVTETGLASRPKSGENRGASLTHTNVVRSLVKVGRAGRSASAETRVTIDPSWRRTNLRLVAFVQEKKSGIVWGAAQVPVEDLTTQAQRRRP